MLKQKTTFVIGAGGSVDFGFPTGPGLQNQIAQLLRTTPDNRRFLSEFVEDALWKQLNGSNWPKERNALMGSAKRIVDAMPVAASIDNYLHTHRSDQYAVLLGKIAITLAVLHAEQNSTLRVRPPSSFPVVSLETSAYRDSWYAPFMRMLTMGSDVTEAGKMLQNVSFVCFNYDRCLELLIIMTLRRYYSISDSEAEKILSEAEIVHPYGIIGDLFDKGGSIVPFGADRIDVAQVAGGIKTFTESVDEEIVLRAKKLVSECNTLVCNYPPPLAKVIGL